MRTLRTFFVFAAAAAVVACGADDSNLGSFDGNGGSDPNAGMGPGGGNTNVNFGGAQDFGFVRRLLNQNMIPAPDAFVDTGFFAEHQTPLPEPVCGQRICAQGMLGAMGNLLDGSPCVLLQVGLNSPVTVSELDAEPLALALVVDVSGSMAGDGKLTFVQQGLRRMLNELSDDDQVALIAYSSEAELLQPLSRVGDGRNDLFDAIDLLQAEGQTNLYAGLETGYRHLIENWQDGYAHRVILLSDGRPTRGRTSEVEILSMSAPYNSDGVGLTTIGLGTDFNQSLMLRLSEQADGNHYFVEDAGALDEVFSEEVDYFTVAVARDLKLNVRMSDYFEVDQAYGAPAFDGDDRGGVLEVPSVFLAGRRTPDDVTPDGGRRGGGSTLLLEVMPTDFEGPEPTETEVATIDVTFTDPRNGQTARDELVIRYPYGPTTVLDSGYFENGLVTKSFVMLNLFVGMQESTRLFHAQQGEAARGMVQRLIAAAEDYNEEVMDADIEADLEILRQMDEVMATLLAPEPSPEVIPENPWPND